MVLHVIACASPSPIQELYLVLSLGSMQNSIALFRVCSTCTVLTGDSFSLSLSWQKKHRSLYKGRIENQGKSARVSFVASPALLDQRPFTLGVCSGQHGMFMSVTRVSALDRVGDTGVARPMPPYSILLQSVLRSFGK